MITRLAVALFLSFGLCHATTPPNIVFIMIDDLGWRDVGCYGNAFVETPHLDRLAKEGMRFTQAYQQTVCSPTRAALLTGMHPVRNGITNYLGPEAGAKFLEPKVVTINERLKEAGYASGLIGKWHLTGNYAAALGSPDKHGWDVIIAPETSYIAGGDYFHPYQHIAGLPARLGPDEYLTDRLTLEACDFISRHGSKGVEKPFFLYLSHYAVHTALAAKPNLLAKYQKKLAALPPDEASKVGTQPALAAMMESVDEGVGRIRETLAQLGIDKNTLFIFTSDNGGESVRGKKGGGLVPSVTSVAPLRAGKSHLYEGGIRVPLLVAWPGMVPSGSVCEVPVNGLDWYPTLLAVAGLKPRGPQPMDGTGIVGLLRNPLEARPGPMFWHYPLEKPHFLGGRSSGAVREGNWKLIEFFDRGESELYDLAQDPGERQNLADTQPGKLEEMQRKLRAWHAGMHVEPPKAWHFLQNDHLKLGVDLGAGASIGWLSAQPDLDRNVINTYDRGRYVQQSYYGGEDGTLWGSKPWRYNPVQGGDWRGLPAKVVSFTAESTTQLYAKTIPRHWATGKLLDECAMEQWITLEGELVYVRFRFTYSGETSHQPHHQELPAFFVEPQFDALVFCDATNAPWTKAALTRKEPGERNEYLRFSEPWLAWVDKTGRAVGLLSPSAKGATCYRTQGAAACSYAAPIDTFALTPGLRHEHEAWLSVGAVEALRARFAALCRE
ncbi:MAG: sulfatase [Roseimicrobium sp.]